MKKSRIKQMSMEVTVGAFMFVALLALGVFTILLSGENIFSPKHYVEAIFGDVMGLREGDSVMVRGLQVGKISKLWLEPDGVHVRMGTDMPLLPREDYAVEILSSSVLGGKYLQVYEGTREARPLEPGTVLIGNDPVDLIDEATETFDAIRAALVDGGILDNLKATMEEVRTITSDISEGKGTLGKLVKDDTSYTKLVELIDNLTAVSKGLKEGEGTIGRLLQDDTLATDLEASVANFREISERLSRGEGTLGKLLAEDDALYADLRQAVASLKTIASRMESGEGTLGKLATDDALYEEAQLLLQEIRAAVDDLRETAPITTFTSIFFGAF